jgi:hypothetical protein
MDLRDAVEADAERLAELTGVPRDVMRNLVHDRTVRVATEPTPDEEDGEAVTGFVSFDARRQTVHVTQFEGPQAALERLLEEPTRFAAGEGMSVELLVASDDETKCAAAEGMGFVEEGPGPRFDGTPTVRYRLDPS